MEAVCCFRYLTPRLALVTRTLKTWLLNTGRPTGTFQTPPKWWSLLEIWCYFLLLLWFHLCFHFSWKVRNSVKFSAAYFNCLRFVLLVWGKIPTPPQIIKNLFSMFVGSRLNRCVYVPVQSNSWRGSLYIHTYIFIDTHIHTNYHLAANTPSVLSLLNSTRLTKYPSLNPHHLSSSSVERVSRPWIQLPCNLLTCLLYWFWVQIWHRCVCMCVYLEEVTFLLIFFLSASLDISAKWRV